MVNVSDARIGIVKGKGRCSHVCSVWCGQRLSQGQSADMSAFKDTAKQT
jgi:hypothetical protein